MDLADMKRKLAGNAALQQLTSSPQGRALAQSAEAAALEQAAAAGDRAALQQALQKLLSTPEGKALAAQVRQAVQPDKSR